MTKQSLHAIALLSSSLVAGCAWFPWSGPSDPPQSTEQGAAKITPYARIQDGADSAAAFHALGRHLQREGRLEDAERAFRRALEFDPQHQETRNALAALYASRGDLAQAITLLASLVSAHPEQPHLLANLGYAHYLNGDYPAAKERLQQSLSLAPDNESTRRKLALVLEKLGEPVDTLSDAPQVAAALPVPVPPPQDMPAPAVLRVSEGVYTLTRKLSADAGRSSKSSDAQCDLPALQTAGGASPAPLAASSSAAQAPAAAVAAAPDAYPVPQRLRIELANGNGVNRLARSVRDLIAGSALPWQVVRVVNHEEFSVPVTRIEYAKHRYEAARELAGTLGVSAQLRPNYQQGDTQLRVVFGQDFRSADSLRERIAESATPALASLN